MPKAQIKGERPKGVEERKMYPKWGGEFKKTHSADELVAMVKIGDPFLYFTMWPIKEVRQACLIKMFEVFMVDEERGSWGRRCVAALLEQQDSMAIDVLRWLIKNNEGEQHSSIGFMLSNIVPREYFGKPEAAYYISWKEAAKLLFAETMRRPGVYKAIPSLFSSFFESVRDEIIKEGKKLGYTDEVWAIFDRLLMIIIAAGDSRKKAGIDLLVNFLQKGIIKPCDDEKGRKKVIHLATLKYDLSLINPKK